MSGQHITAGLALCATAYASARLLYTTINKETGETVYERIKEIAWPRNCQVSHAARAYNNNLVKIFDSYGRYDDEAEAITWGPEGAVEVCVEDPERKKRNRRGKRGRFICQVVSQIKARFGSRIPKTGANERAVRAYAIQLMTEAKYPKVCQALVIDHIMILAFVASLATIESEQTVEVLERVVRDGKTHSRLNPLWVGVRTTPIPDKI